MSKNAITKSLPLWESNGLPSQYNGQMQDNRTSQSLDARNIASSLAESMKRASALRRHLPE